MNQSFPPPEPPADTASQAGYIRRFTRVIEYIYAHLDEAPDLNTLADVAALSPWHWHRIWQSVYGESVIETVKRLRLQRAAADLAHTDMPVDAIWPRAGYGSLAAFSRSFKDAYGMPPTEYRKSGSHKRYAAMPVMKEGDAAMRAVEIKTLAPAMLAVIPHRGSYMEIGKVFETLFGTLAARGLLRPDLRMTGLFYSDPTSVPETELRSAAGVIVPQDFPIAAPLERAELRGGDYAVLRHKGPYSDMKAAYDWLYGEWLVQSGREAADAPVFEEYLNNPREVPPTKLMTDICLPLR